MCDEFRIQSIRSIYGGHMAAIHGYTIAFSLAFAACCQLCFLRIMEHSICCCHFDHYHCRLSGQQNYFRKCFSIISETHAMDSYSNQFGSSRLLQILQFFSSISMRR